VTSDQLLTAGKCLETWGKHCNHHKVPYSFPFDSGVAAPMTLPDASGCSGSQQARISTGQADQQLQLQAVLFGCELRAVSCEL